MTGPIALTCALIAAALGGFSRGFAAFGTAMIYIPLLTMAYDARTAVVTLFLVDILPSLPLFWRAASQCDRRTILSMAVGAMVFTPLGVSLLLVADRTASELIIGMMLLAAISHMYFRPHFRIRATFAKSVAAGAVSGFAGGLCGIFGPPAMVYLLGCRTDARRLRADTIVYLTGQSLGLGVTYAFYRMYTAQDLRLSLLLLPVYGLCLWYGAHRFSSSSEAAYRRVVFGLLTAVSILLIAKSVITLAP